HHRNWTGFRDQKNYAMSLCTNPWIFTLDADEEASTELQKKVIEIINQESNSISCYRVRREEYFLGRHLTGGPGNPSFQERLSRKGSVEYIGSIHEYPMLLSGEYGLIQEKIYH